MLRALTSLGLVAAAIGIGAQAAESNGADREPNFHSIQGRGDVTFLPAPLQSRLVELARRPHSYLSLTVFGEADAPSQLFAYYLLDTTAFSPNVFTSIVPGTMGCWRRDSNRARRAWVLSGFLTPVPPVAASIPQDADSPLSRRWPGVCAKICSPPPSRDAGIPSRGFCVSVTGVDVRVDGHRRHLGTMWHDEGRRATLTRPSAVRAPYRKVQVHAPRKRVP